MCHVEKVQKQHKQTTTTLLIPTCILSLVLSSTTSSPSWILAILPMKSHPSLVYIIQLSPDCRGNITLTCRRPLVGDLPSFQRQILAMPNTSSPLGRLRMPPRSLRFFRKSPTSLSPLRQLEIT